MQLMHDTLQFKKKKMLDMSGRKIEENKIEENILIIPEVKEE